MNAKLKTALSAETEGVLLRKRKMLLTLPVVIILFITLGFWALGGGGSKRAEAKNAEGLNLNLPSSGQKKEGSSDKLSFYELAAKDSEKLEEEIKKDPYYKTKDMLLTTDIDFAAKDGRSKYAEELNKSPYNMQSKKPEEEILKKVALLEQQLNKTKEPYVDSHASITKESFTSPALSFGIDRPEALALQPSALDTDDPELEKMDGLLGKILDIQHPERVRWQLKEQKGICKDSALKVIKIGCRSTVSLLGSAGSDSVKESGFFSGEKRFIQPQNAIQAVVHQSQILSDGSLIQLRLLDDLSVAGTIVPKESFVYGTCNLSGERLKIEIHSVRTGSFLLPVDLELYDRDGLEGISIPGSPAKDVLSQSADNTMQLLELSAMDPSLKAKVAEAGISTLKNLLTKKVKQVRVMVKAGYSVLLKEKHN